MNAVAKAAQRVRAIARIIPTALPASTLLKKEPAGSFFMHAQNTFEPVI